MEEKEEEEEEGFVDVDLAIESKVMMGFSFVGLAAFLSYPLIMQGRVNSHLCTSCASFSGDFSTLFSIASFPSLLFRPLTPHFSILKGLRPYPYMSVPIRRLGSVRDRDVVVG
jgi:hypothetical protein